MTREIDEIAGITVDAAYKLHTGLGPGLLESVYEKVLARELERRELAIVELKPVEKLAPVHSKQLLTYPRLLKLPIGLLINFGGATLKEGPHRIVNNYVPSLSATPRLRVNEPKP